MDIKYIPEAIEHLKKDPILKKVIEQHTIPEWKEEHDLFFDLVDSIISQQLSVKAGATILSRFQNLFTTQPLGSPEEILALPDDTIRACGISYPKIKYIKGLALAVKEKQIDLENLKTLSDDEVLTELIKLKGIGKWTAEMLMIFSLHRNDIFSLGDLGLVSAVSKLYGVDRKDLKKIQEISEKWSPYRSLASRYLWKSLDNEPLSTSAE